MGGLSNLNLACTTLGSGQNYEECFEHETGEIDLRQMRPFAHCHAIGRPSVKFTYFDLAISTFNQKFLIFHFSEIVLSEFVFCGEIVRKK